MVVKKQEALWSDTCGWVDETNTSHHVIIIMGTNMTSQDTACMHSMHAEGDL